MKTGNLVIAIVFLLAGSVTMKSLAQENIKALIKKFENMDVIDANIVRNKHSNRNTISYSNSRPNIQSIRSPQSIINYTIKYTPELEKELVAAFRKDQEKAIREVEQRKEGKVTHMLYQFDDSEYSFTVKNDTISIQATEGQLITVTTQKKNDISNFITNPPISVPSLKWQVISFRNERNEFFPSEMLDSLNNGANRIIQSGGDFFLINNECIPKKTQSDLESDE